MGCRLVQNEDFATWHVQRYDVMNGLKEDLLSAIRWDRNCQTGCFCSYVHNSRPGVAGGGSSASAIRTELEDSDLARNCAEFMAHRYLQQSETSVQFARSSTAE